jgi:hypothetical protein
MRTLLFLTSGFLLMASVLIAAKLFSEHAPSAPNWALALSLGVWLAVTGANMWLGVSKAGYSVAEELPILMVLFAVPAAAAVLARWRFF